METNSNFQPTSYSDIIVFSGEDVDYTRQFSSSSSIKLIGKAGEKALSDLKQSYENYKSSLKLTYTEFLTKVETNLAKLNNSKMPMDKKQKLIAKLNALATAKITQEKNSSKIDRFFQRVIQFFKGHGFQTEGEWGQTVVFKLTSVTANQKSSNHPQLDFLISQLKPLLNDEINNIKLEDLSNSQSYLSAESQLIALKDTINALSDDEFRHVLDLAIFNQFEKSYFKNNKLIFYGNLTDEKKDIFYSVLLAKKDWFAYASDFIENADIQEIEHFVSPTMIQHFHENLNVIEMSRQDTQQQKFLKTLSILSARAYVRENSLESYQKLASLLTQLPFDYRTAIQLDVDYFTTQDKTNFRANIRIN